jgi:hypothetical protein
MPNLSVNDHPPVDAGEIHFLFERETFTLVRDRIVRAHTHQNLRADRARLCGAINGHAGMKADNCFEVGAGAGLFEPRLSSEAVAQPSHPGWIDIRTRQ